MLNCTSNNKNIRSHCNGNCEMMNQKKKKWKNPTDQPTNHPTNGGMEYLEIFFSGIDPFVRVFIHHKRMHMEVSTLFWRNETLDMHMLIVLCNKSQMHEKDSSQHLKSSSVCSRPCVFYEIWNEFFSITFHFCCTFLSLSLPQSQFAFWVH